MDISPHTNTINVTPTTLLDPHNNHTTSPYNQEVENIVINITRTNDITNPKEVIINKRETMDIHACTDHTLLEYNGKDLHEPLTTFSDPMADTLTL